MNSSDESILNPLKDNDDDKIIDNNLSHDLLTSIMHKERPPHDLDDVSTKTRYVLGFAICPEHKQVLLIRKNRPLWQAGFLNGIGGKIEKYDDSPFIAMQREFIEETGLLVPADKWNLFSELENSRFKMYVFWTQCDNIDHFKSVTDEEVLLVDIDLLYQTKFNQCISNLSWLIPMIMDRDIKKISCNINYND